MIFFLIDESISNVALPIELLLISAKFLKSEITLFDNLTIPKEWTNSDVDTAGNFKIKISAEAIQSKGFVDATEAFTQLSKEVTE